MVECRAEGGRLRRRERTDDGGTFSIAWSPFGVWCVVVFLFLDEGEEYGLIDRALWRM